jgi:hypothetical protein
MGVSSMEENGIDPAASVNCSKPNRTNWGYLLDSVDTVQDQITGIPIGPTRIDANTVEQLSWF